MCILKIHANSHTANAVQSAAHNMDTTVSDLDTLARLLEQRGHKTEAMAARLASFHVSKQRARVWDMWNELIEPASTFNDSLPIGSEVEHNEVTASVFRTR